MNSTDDDLPMTSFAYKSREFSFYNFIEEISVTFCVNDLKVSKSLLFVSFVSIEIFSLKLSFKNSILTLSYLYLFCIQMIEKTLN
jgi:hypothetical protein